MLRELKVFWAALRTTPAVVNCFGIGSALILVTKVVWLNSIPAPLAVMAKLSDVAKDLLSANVAGYIFFVVSFQLPQVIERRRLIKVVARLLDLTANRVTGFLQMLSTQLGRGRVEIERVTLSEVKEMFGSVSPKAVAPMAPDYFSARVGWLAAMALHDEQCLAYIAKLWRYSRFFDADVVALLDNIEFSAHSEAMREARQFQLRDPESMGNPNMASWASSYFEAYDFARQLIHYTTEYRRLYTP